MSLSMCEVQAQPATPSLEVCSEVLTALQHTKITYQIPWSRTLMRKVAAFARLPSLHSMRRSCLLTCDNLTTVASLPPVSSGTLSVAAAPSHEPQRQVLGTTATEAECY